MEIKIQNEIFVFSNQNSEIEKIFNVIHDELEKKSLQLKYLIVDDVMVKDDYYAYFTENIESIKIVEVVCKHLETLINEILYSTYRYLKNGKIEIKDLANTFYKGVDNEDWKKLADLFEGLQWLINTQSQIDQIKKLDTMIKSHQVWNEYAQAIKMLITILPELEEAMKQQDHVLLGDLLLYEVLPFFETGEKKLLFLIPNTGDHNVS